MQNNQAPTKTHNKRLKTVIRVSIYKRISKPPKLYRKIYIIQAFSQKNNNLKKLIALKG